MLISLKKLSYVERLKQLQLTTLVSYTDIYVETW